MIDIDLIITIFCLALSVSLWLEGVWDQRSRGEFIKETSDRDNPLSMASLLIN